MRFVVFGAALLAAMTAFAAPSGEMAWQKSIVQSNNAWADKRWAILKIDDAIYLKDGQNAFLIRTASGYKWTMSAPAGLAPTIKFANGKALLRMLGRESDLDLLTATDNVLALNDRVDIKAQITQVEPGENDLRVMVYNQDNPKAKEFAGLEYYPYSRAFVVEATFAPLPAFVAEDFQTSRGWWKRFYRAGEATFTLNGKEHRLPFYSGTDKPAEIKELSAFFMDELTGKETYGVGRYVDVPVDGELPKTITIDFNAAYNPNCARSPHFNCPQAKVTLATEIRAGERKPRTFPVD